MKKIIGLSIMTLLLSSCSIAAKSDIVPGIIVSDNDFGSYNLTIIADHKTGAEFAVYTYKNNGFVSVTQVLGKDGKPVYLK